jgi:hypothetical protein
MLSPQLPKERHLGDGGKKLSSLRSTQTMVNTAYFGSKKTSKKEIEEYAEDTSSFSEENKD